MVEKRGNSKRSQIAIFIILALAIIVILILLFIGKEKIASIISPEPPIEQIKKCMQESLSEGIAILTSQGGSIKPENYYLYQNKTIQYLCYTNEYYKTCVVQKPMLKQTIEKELKNYAEPKISSCINSVKSSLQDKGYKVSMKEPEVSVELVPGYILGEVGIDLSIIKDKTLTYSSIKTDISSRLYDIAMVANSIINWEARYGDSETTTYMWYYPSIKVEKKKQSDGTTIYILTERNTLEKFTFASRSLAWPAGYGFNKR